MTSSIQGFVCSPCINSSDAGSVGAPNSGIFLLMHCERRTKNEAITNYGDANVSNKRCLCTLGEHVLNHSKTVKCKGTAVADNGVIATVVRQKSRKGEIRIDVYLEMEIRRPFKAIGLLRLAHRERLVVAGQQCGDVCVVHGCLHRDTSVPDFAGIDKLRWLSHEHDDPASQLPAAAL